MDIQYVEVGNQGELCRYLLPKTKYHPTGDLFENIHGSAKVVISPILLLVGSDFTGECYPYCPNQPYDIKGEANCNPYPRQGKRKIGCSHLVERLKNYKNKKEMKMIPAT